MWDLASGDADPEAALEATGRRRVVWRALRKLGHLSRGARVAVEHKSFFRVIAFEPVFHNPVDYIVGNKLSLINYFLCNHAEFCAFLYTFPQGIAC